MNHECQSAGLPDILVEHICTGQNGLCFRRRAVMMNTNSELQLLCCTVERLAPCAADSSASSHLYSNAVLYEDFLTEEQCLRFARELHDRRSHVGECAVEVRHVPQWQPIPVSADNEYMPSAGLVLSVDIGDRGAYPPIAPLLAVDQPYYPDIYEAARDWLPFPTYHGQSDGRSNQITFLLSEDRAFIKKTAFDEPGKLTIEVAGTKANEMDLLVKGAYWKQRIICHFEQSVACLKTIVAVPEDADRLEFYLLERDGRKFDFYKEVRSLRARVLRASENALETMVRDAAAAGEGQKIEFKPFVEPDSKMKGDGGERSKLHEVIVTAVAFANAEGGVIYLGVDDDCQIAGINSKLGKWAKDSVCDNVIDRYLGALRSCIKSNVTGELILDTSYAWLDDALIAMIHVQATENGPIGVRQDSCLYARSGASNRKVPPEQLEKVFEKFARASRPFQFDSHANMNR